jgi:hypothetical protein
VLNRLQAFLPEIKRANEELEEDLQRNDPSLYNIESVDESKPYIQMVSCTVLRKRTFWIKITKLEFRSRWREQQE